MLGTSNPLALGWPGVPSSLELLRPQQRTLPPVSAQACDPPPGATETAVAPFTSAIGVGSSVVPIVVNVPQHRTEPSESTAQE